MSYLKHRSESLFNDWTQAKNHAVVVCPDLVNTAEEAVQGLTACKLGI